MFCLTYTSISSSRGFLFKRKEQLDKVAHAFNPSILEARSTEISVS